jgi:hypothetical protein
MHIEWVLSHSLWCLSPWQWFKTDWTFLECFLNRVWSSGRVQWRTNWNSNWRHYASCNWS